MFSNNEDWFNESETVLNYDKVPTPRHAKVEFDEISHIPRHKPFTDYVLYLLPFMFVLFFFTCALYFMYY
jgi:hypothetical protein